jgi:ABC-type glycerol-3-phosphate transport system permease component
MRRYTRERFLKQFGRLAGLTVLILTTILLMLPIITLVVTSLKLDSEYNRYPIVFFPQVPQWVNYQTVLTLARFAQAAWRTTLLGIPYAIIITTTSALAGYAFARYPIPASGKLFGVVIALLIVPEMVILIPTFIVFAQFKLHNTYWPWVLWALAGSPFYIFLFRQFFLNFPKELEDAAEVDGCGPLRIFLQIFLPNSTPVIATVMFFAFNAVWASYLVPLIFLNDSQQLLGVVLATEFKNPRGITLTTLSMAGTVIYIFPPVIAFFLAQRHILKGVITSGLKG